MAAWKEPKSNYTAESQVTPEIFNTLAENEKYLQEKKITTEQVQNAEINSVQSGTRESIGDKETVKRFFGKIRKWLADLKTLAFKSTVATNDIDNTAVTSAKIGTGAVTSVKLASSAVTAVKLAANAVETAKIKDAAVTDAKIDSVSASKVTGLHKVATSGSYNDLTDKPSINGGGSDFGATFIVDSNDKLSQWIRADSGNDYSVVLIKKGTWQCDELLYDLTLSGSKKYYAGVNLSKSKTKVVIGEVGSKIYFKVDPKSLQPIRGLYYGESSDADETECFMYGVTVHSCGSSAYTDVATDCFGSCVNLYNCKAISENGYESYCFTSCKNLNNCYAIGSSEKLTYAFFACKSLLQCIGHATAVTANRKFLGGCAVGFKNCNDVISCKGSGISIPSTADYTAYGFSSCKGVYRCKQNKKSSTETFTSSYYGNTTDANYKCDNTLNGGFNDTANA